VTAKPSPSGLHDDSDKSRSAVIAGLVHDLRAPIHTMLGWTSLLRRKHDPERLEHALTTIERNARLQIALLEDLLALTRPSWTQSPLHREPIDLGTLVASEIHALEPLAQKRGVNMTTTLDTSGITVEANEVHLRRVVANLVGNALKFTPSGGTVACRLWKSADLACFVVRDSGRGILREFLPNVFDPFWQEPDTLRGKGHGVGLSVVRHLVELNGGSVRAESDGRGRGATFTVLLPVMPVASPSNRRVSSLHF
jgi:signal transduction histidine kinase